MLPITPNHDGVRQFLWAFPFLAALAARGLTAFAGWARPRVGAAALPAVAALALLPQATSLVRSHPYGLSYYNVGIGGLSGAADAGMEPTYWMEAFTPAVLEDLEAALPPGARVNPVVGDPFYFRYLQHVGRLRSDLILERDPSAPHHLVLFRISELGFERARILRERPAASEIVYESSRDGVPLVRLLRRGGGALSGGGAAAD